MAHQSDTLRSMNDMLVPLLHVLRRIHVHEGRLILCRFLPTSTELGEARSLSLLGQALICQNTAYVFMFNNEPRATSIPEFHLRDRVIGAEMAVLDGRLSCGGAREGELGRTLRELLSVY